MKIKDRPEFTNRSRVLTFAPDATVLEAVKAMSEKNYGSCVIVDGGGDLAGLFTERDLMRRVVAAGREPGETKLSEVMTKELKVARAEDNLIDWLRQMSNERFRHLPVVDEKGELQAMMSQGDFVSYTWPDLIDRVAEQTRATIAPNYQIALIVGGIMIYSLAMILIFNS